MIETNILDWIEVGDKLETLEIFKNKKNQYLFRFFSGLRKFNEYGLIFHLVLKILFFLQILCLDSMFIKKTDFLTNIFSILRPYVFFTGSIDTKNSYLIGFILICVFNLLIVTLSTIIFFQIRKGMITLNFPFNFFNMLITLLKEIFIGPLIWVILLIFKCDNNMHKYLETNCYSSANHLIIFIISIVILLFILTVIYLVSIFSNECGSIKDIRILNSISSSYEILASTAKITIFIFAFCVKNFSNSTSDSGADSSWIEVFYCLFVFLISFFTSYYTYKHVLFNNEILYKTILHGWCVTTWYSLLIFFKTVLKIDDIVIIFVIGLMIIIILIEIFEMQRIEYLLMENQSNAKNNKSLKEIELFKINMLNLLNQKSDKEKTILLGITKIYKDHLSKNEEVEEKFKRLIQNEHLQEKYNNRKALEILAQIFISYHIHLEKSLDKNEILMNLCYFLINSMKNFTYVSYLISKSKASTLKEKYQKFILIEEIKDHMLLKLNNSQKMRNNDYIKNVQISSVILLESYCDILKTKINESIYQRVEYFEMMTTRIGVGNSNLSLKNLMEVGEKILNKLRDIQKIAALIRELNPFDEEIFNHYHFYLDIINKDYKVAVEEKKKLNELKLNRMSERGNIYFSLFETNSNIILVDGYNNKGNIIYASKNFFINFKTNPNELYLKTVHDLVPTAIKDFHEEIIENGIKYSNLSYVFNKQRMLLLKNTKGILHSTKVYIKSIPNLKHGLIYIVSIIKIEDQSGIIVLDSDMIVDGLTDFFSQDTIDFYLSRNRKRGDNNPFNERHITMIIPEIVNHIRFNPRTGKFYFVNNNSEFKGSICNLEKADLITNLLKDLMEMIRQNSLNEYEFRKNTKNSENMDKLSNPDERISVKSLQIFNETLNTFVNAVKENSKRIFKVFFKINTKNFIGNKYQYHKISLHKDLSGNGDDIIFYDKMKTHGTNSSNLHHSPIGENNFNLKTQIKHEIKLNIAKRHSQLENHEILNLDNLLGTRNEKIEDTAEQKNNMNRTLDRRNYSMSRSTSFSTASSELATLLSFKILLKTNEISIFRRMKQLAFFFSAATLFFLTYFYVTNSYEKYDTFNENLWQAKFFNNSKLVVSQIYYNALNTKMYINDFYDNENCYNSNCEEFYKNQIDNSISLLNNLNTNSTFFHEQFSDIIFSTKNINLELFMKNDSKIINTFSVSHKNLIDLIISYSLNLKNFLSSINTYSDSNILFNENEEMTIENILNQSYSYLTYSDIFINSNAIDNMAILKNYSQLFLILCLSKTFLIFFILASFLYFTYSIFYIEKTHLSNLINFKNPLFLDYIKFLSDEWKRISQNYDLEMQKKDDEEELQESNDVNTGNPKNKKEKEFDKRKFMKNESVSIAKDKPNKNSGKPSEKPTSKIIKDKKLLQKKKRKLDEIQNKISSIKNYLYKFHSYFFIKILAIIVISSSYIAIITIIDKQKITEISQLDKKLDELYNIYLESNSIYFEVKSSFAGVINREIKKNKTIEDYILKNPNSNTPIEFEGIIYNSIDSLQNSITYQLKFPNITTDTQVISLFRYLTKEEENIKLSDLYFGNACEVLYDSEDNKDLKSFCEQFWFGVLTKGFEQSLTKLISIYTAISEDFRNVNLNNKKLNDLFKPDSNLQFYQNFMEIFFFDSFVKMDNLFREIKAKIPYEIDSLYVNIFVLYVILLIILTFFNLSIILTAKRSFNSLMNYVYIIPAEFIVADLSLYSQVLKLEKIF